ncbi:MAG: ribosome recycling factor [Phototrophicales bacterium]|nr:MAG: ribosome recycling factor [Phototrophicales bacterium]
MIKSILKDAESKMQQTLQVLEHELMGMRTGRASTALVERITVEYYGSPVPLNTVAGLSVPEPQTIMINPYDRTILKDIERAIMNSDIGLTPNNDGNVIRLNIPPLTKERRQELVKLVGKRLEESRIAVRNIRRSAIDELRKKQKAGELSEDDLRHGEDEIQKLTDRYIKMIDDMGKRKEEEIMEV